MKDFFVSYHSGDVEWVRDLVRDLEARGVSAWRDGDQLRPGDVFVEALGEGLEGSRCVLAVISNGSVNSKWVREECNLALTRRMHIICVLIDDARPWGFLESRSFVDCRDPSRRAANLDQLLFGISGKPQGSTADSAPRPSPIEGTDASASPSINEVELLERRIERVESDLRQYQRVRLLSPMAGLVVPLLFWLVAGQSSGTVLAALLVGSPLFTGLIGWGATAVELGKCKRERKTFLEFLDGLQYCSQRSNPGCMKLRQKFFDDVLSKVGFSATQLQTDA